MFLWSFGVCYYFESHQSLKSSGNILQAQMCWGFASYLLWSLKTSFPDLSDIINRRNFSVDDDLKGAQEIKLCNLYNISSSPLHSDVEYSTWVPLVCFYQLNFLATNCCVCMFYFFIFNCILPLRILQILFFSFASAFDSAEINFKCEFMKML